MGACSQLKLVLWKNIVLRLRQPVILALELLWPITIFLIVLLLRKAFSPVNQETCYYNARALPSAGGLPVLQSLICNVDNKCLNKSSYQEIPTYPGSRIHELVHDLSPLLRDDSILSVIKALPVLADLLRPLEGLFADEMTQRLLGKGLPLMDVIGNKRYARSVFLSRTNMTPETVDQLLESRINIPAVLHTLGTNAKQGLRQQCNVETISSYIMPDDARVLHNVAASLCTMSEESQKDLMKDLQSAFDYGKIMSLLSHVVNSLGLEDFSFLIKQVAGMVTAFVNIGDEMPSDFSGSLDGLRDLIEDLSDERLNVDLLEAVWADVGQVVRSPEKELVNSVMKWITGAPTHDGYPIGHPGFAPHKASLQGPQPTTEGTLGDVLHTAVKFVNDLQSPSSSGSKASRFFKALFTFDKSSSIGDMLRILDELMSTKDERPEETKKRQDAMYYAGRLVGVVVEFMQTDLQRAFENGQDAFFS